MAKPIQFTGAGINCSAQIEKVDREKLYGWVDKKAYDDKGGVCATAYLLEDGKTLIPSGGFALKPVSNEGEEVLRKDLIAKDANGQLLALIPSAFDQPIVLRPNATIEDYLDLQVKSVYQLTLESGKDDLIAALANQLLAFDFNYRAGYEQDIGYLIPADGQIFAVIGRPAQFEFIKLETPPVDAEEDASEDDDGLDFGML